MLQFKLLRVNFTLAYSLYFCQLLLSNLAMYKFRSSGTTQVLRHFSLFLIVGFSFSACPLSLANIKFKMPPSYYCELCVRLYQLSRASGRAYN
jgi:hypothetical protein